ncbi:MAG: tyrosine-type recombinase/integrase [Proteobacteria bacterium]|nr:tyrosine-type recombinase/integrase [Pseudomonadota bacterium]
MMDEVIRKTLRKPKYQSDLPEIYDEYLDYYEKSRQVPYRLIKATRGVLVSFHDYLGKHKIDFSSLKIEQVDAFLAEFFENFAPATKRSYRSMIRGFLRYLYHERGIIRRDLAPMVVGRRIYAREKPPRFLRPQEVQKLFASLNLSSPRDIRTYAMVHLAYTMGLRPVEISRITLDDISFSKGELTVRNRKNNHSMTLPVPENTIKAIAAYVVDARPASKCRTLLLRFHKPYVATCPGTVVGHIRRCMKKAGIPGSAYWLRHTYAQNLLETGVTIYEIKEMLGHDKIESTKNYLHVHTKMMREVLFDETL